MKTLVTHTRPDLDACASVWLIQKFLPGWSDTQIAFVAAGETLDGSIVDNDPNIIHVDTGLGQFDHHQRPERTSATKLVFDYLKQNDHVERKLLAALERMVFIINEFDHFAEAYFPDATNDRYDFCLNQVLKGMTSVGETDISLCEKSRVLFSSILQIFRNKTRAEEEIKEGYVFQSKWGRSLVMETGNEEAMNLALKMGFFLVARKEPTKGHIRIKTLPDKRLNLTPLYDQLILEDKKASWFLHISKNMLLNGSSKNPKLIASTISLKRLIEIIRKI